MATTPVLLFPPSEDFSTNLEEITLSGTVDVGSFEVLVNGNPATTFVPATGVWTFFAILVSGLNTFEVASRDTAISPLGPILTVNITFTAASELGLLISQPTGLSVDRFIDAVELFAVRNPEPEVLGYNFYVAEEKGGGIDGYRRLNVGLVEDPSKIEEQITTISETQTQVGPTRTTTVVEEVTEQTFFSFRHERGQDPLVTLPDSEELFYVITAVGQDTLTTNLIESPFSAEIATRPLTVTNVPQQLPVRTQQDIALTYITRILTSDNTIDVKPLTFTRDVIIDPPSEEFERLYLILDFLHRSQSFPTLLEIDDEDGDGVSDDVLTPGSFKNTLREALLVDEDDAQVVQDLVDAAFTKLAKNSQTDRLPAQQATGNIVLFATRLPATDRVIAEQGSFIETKTDAATGLATQRFEVLSQVDFVVADSGQFFNIDTQRFEYTARIRAVDSGAAGNVEPNTITVPVSGIDALFKVTNPNPTRFGSDIEANRRLAERALLAFISVDSGTEPGYLANTLKIPGVVQARIQKAGDRFMFRDLDPLRKIHIGGKVDIYVQSVGQAQITEQFAFIFESAENEQARIKSVANLEFAVLNEDVSATSPIFEVIEVKNATKAQLYDVTGATITGDGNVIDLDELISLNVTIGLDPDDIIFVTYRFRAGSDHKFRRQPVIEVDSVVGNLSGNLPSVNFALIKADDPLDVGGSVRANDALRIISSGGLPSEDFEVITDEAKLMVGETPVDLDNFGVQLSTIVVTDITATITHVLNTDYGVIDDGETTSIFRIATGAIPSGATVLVDYESGENFIVTYNVDTAVEQVQNEIDVFRHLTADALSKQALTTFVDIGMVVILEPTSTANQAAINKSAVNTALRTDLARLFNGLGIGQALHPSDVIAVVDSTNGVDFVETPLSELVRKDGTQIIREFLETPLFTTFQTGTKTSFVSTATLDAATTEGGGPIDVFRAVYEDQIEMTLVTNQNTVSEASDQAFINADGTIVVSPRNDDDPNLHQYTVTYVAEGETGQKDIVVSEIEKIELGTLDITFVEVEDLDSGF